MTTHPVDDEPEANPTLSALIDHAVVQLEASTDESTRRAWRRVRDDLEAMIPGASSEAAA